MLGYSGTMADRHSRADEAHTIQVALVPAHSPFANAVRSAARSVGAEFVRAEARSPAELADRVLVVDLSHTYGSPPLGDRTIAIATRADLDCYDVISPSQVRSRLPRALRNLVEREQLRSRLRQEREQIGLLNELGYSLSAQTSQASLLDSVLTHARRLTRADGGSLYLVEEDETLRLVCSQNDTLPYVARDHERPLDESSLPGMVAVHGEPLNLADAYQIPHGLAHRPDFTFDRQTGYRTRSVLLVPLKDRENAVVGVILLVNCKARAGVPITDFKRIGAFDEHAVDVARSVASQAAVALENWRLYSNIRNLFDGFVRAAVTAIEARDPTTGGHSHRVAELTLRLAREVHTSDERPFREQSFSGRDLTELYYASMLHDFGKVGVREEVLLKAEKLFDWEMTGIEYRFQLARLQVTLEFAEGEVTESGVNPLLPQAAYDNMIRRLADDLEFVRYMNRPSTRPSTMQIARLREISQEWQLPDLGRPVIEARHIRRLCIPRGSLDPAERKEIEAHVTHTYTFLREIPWTSDLSRVPELAFAHHEKLDGSGYPRGLRGAEIPFGARVMAVADIFDALTASDRPYKQSMNPVRALSILREEASAGRVEHEVVELLAGRRLWEGMVGTAAPPGPAPTRFAGRKHRHSDSGECDDDPTEPRTRIH